MNHIGAKETGWISVGFGQRLLVGMAIAASLWACGGGDDTGKGQDASPDLIADRLAPQPDLGADLGGKDSVAPAETGGVPEAGAPDADRSVSTATTTVTTTGICTATRTALTGTVAYTGTVALYGTKTETVSSTCTVTGVGTVTVSSTATR